MRGDEVMGGERDDRGPGARRGWNTLDYSVAVFDASFRKKLATIKVCEPPHTPEWRRGL